MDFFIIALIIVLSFCSLLFIPKNADTVTIMQHGKVLYSGDINKDAVIVTPDGKNEITIKNGNAYMSEADCKDQLCVKMGFATNYRPVICLPNEVVIFISGKGADIDGVTFG
ncbi:MAG: NusG domain II-containing protein [Clostridiales bacterium]|nr:NusG domain II-containing protein [Clostridiales bacterium]